MNALVHACPKTLPDLLRVAGFGPDKVEKYGAEICAICRGETSLHPAIQTARADKPAATPGSRPERSKSESGRNSEGASKPAPLTRVEVSAQRGVPQEVFKRERLQATDPSDSLDPAQQALEIKLRAWRKSESERIGLPQFFVLGTTTLRNIVMSRPQTLAELKGISGIDPEKLDKFGTSIIDLCTG